MYRVEYKSASLLSNGQIGISFCLYSSEDGTTWVQVDRGTGDISLQAADVLAITQDDTLTDAQKAGAINQLLLERIEGLGLTQSRDALQELEALLPSGWPITVNL